MDKPFILKQTENYFMNSNNFKIHYRHWPNKSNDFIILIPGYNSHFNISHINEIAELMPNINILTFDHQGQGYSYGEKVLIKNYNHLVDDTLQFITLILKEFTVNKYALCGSSMGGSITIEAIKRMGPKQKEKYCGCVLLAPAIGINQNIPIAEYLLHNYLSYYFPNYKFPSILNLKVNTYDSIKDEKNIELSLSDPLTHKENIKIATASNIVLLAKQNTLNTHRLHKKIIILHDVNDKVTSFQKSHDFSNQVNAVLIPLFNMKHDVLLNCPYLVCSYIQQLFS